MLRLFVTVGTDHHRFDRLIQWTDRWVESKGQQVDYVVQHGSSAPSALASNHEIVTSGELVDLLQESDVVVAQAGPGSVLEARAQGRLPVIVPRLHRFKEAVDDHQVLFAALMMNHGHAVTVGTEEDLHEELDRMALDPLRRAADPPALRTRETANAVLEHLERLRGNKPGTVDLRRMRDLVSARNRARRRHHAE